MLRALLVDDEETILGLLKTVLERDGFNVSTASSAKEALDVLQTRRFDMVLTDLRMETPMAGFDVVRAANAAVPRPVVVLVTAYPVPSAEWRLAGADALFLKGADTVGLPARLKALLPRRSASA